GHHRGDDRRARDGHGAARGRADDGRHRHRGRRGGDDRALGGRSRPRRHAPVDALVRGAARAGRRGGGRRRSGARHRGRCRQRLRHRGGAEAGRRGPERAGQADRAAGDGRPRAERRSTRARRSFPRSPAPRISRASASSSSIRTTRCGPDSSSTREAPAMKALVLGGGVVGVTTAYFLAKAGHEVTLVEEKDALGLEATGGNAGIIAPGHSFAWASPRAPRMLWQSLRGAETAIRVRLTRDPWLYAWGLRFLRECTSGRARRTTLIQLQLCDKTK